ncbi:MULTISPECIES: hypothetical protein [Pyrobaculum]|uniref:Uncharacterized protein n=1 Tax=Pyrobaculum arsenaticum TaxID=121277 RepID=A0A7L4P920_9CREN|nr:hypothetical protein [Pyrobaculum arsenaticum]MCY0891692.1 hypothetical protein [Pyrobaculum arsenaticum]NYR15202.1 hypothetical protein [Pyrobaculum arsenaticum]
MRRDLPHVASLGSSALLISAHLNTKSRSARRDLVVDGAIGGLKRFLLNVNGLLTPLYASRGYIGVYGQLGL